MARPSFRTVPHGTTVTARFHGSAVFGNSVFDDEVKVLRTEDPDRRVLADTSTDAPIAEIYFHENRWRYGTSAEVVSIVA